MASIKGHWQLLMIAALIVALWGTPVLFPLRLLVVFFHEASHVLAALLTGGSVDSLSLSALEGGEVWSRGGNRFVTLSAGYVGSLLIGVALFFLALRTDLDRLAMAGLGMVTLLIAAVYVRDWFAFGFCAGMGAGMIAMARTLPRAASDLGLRVLGLTSMMYVPLDIVSDTITRSNLPSDARMLAEEFGGATVIWGGLWLLISLCVIGAALRYGLGPDSNFRRVAPD